MGVALPRTVQVLPWASEPALTPRLAWRRVVFDRMASHFANRMRKVLGVALAGALVFVCLAGTSHRHEPCHEGLHVSTPHASESPDVCAVCRAAQAKGAESAPLAALADVLQVATSLRPPAARAVAMRVPLETSPRAPPALFSVPV